MRHDIYKLTSALLLFILILGNASLGAEESKENVLKIGTPNMVKSAHRK